MTNGDQKLLNRYILLAKVVKSSEDNHMIGYRIVSSHNTEAECKTAVTSTSQSYKILDIVDRTITSIGFEPTEQARESLEL